MGEKGVDVASDARRAGVPCNTPPNPPPTRATAYTKNPAAHANYGKMGILCDKIQMQFYHIRKE